MKATSNPLVYWSLLDFEGWNILAASLTGYRGGLEMKRKLLQLETK